MPRPSGLILALAAGLAAPSWAQEAVDCTPSLLAGGAGTEVEISLAAPCHPYLAVTVLYGPLRVQEESSGLGDLVLSLPRISGEPHLAVLSDALDLVVQVPDGPVSPFVAVDWGDSAPWGRLQGASMTRLGFRHSDGQPHVDVASGGGPVTLAVDVTDETCGQPREAMVSLSGLADPVPLSVTLPDCSNTGARLEIPLAD